MVIKSKQIAKNIKENHSIWKASLWTGWIQYKLHVLLPLSKEELTFKTLPCTFSCYIIFFWFSVPYRTFLTNGYSVFLWTQYNFFLSTWQEKVKEHENFSSIAKKIDVSQWKMVNQEGIGVIFRTYTYHHWKVLINPLSAREMLPISQVFKI